MNTEYSTKDLHFAAYLKLKDVELLRLERKTPEPRSPVFFIFKDIDACKAFGKKYWEEGDYINVKDYLAIIHDLRSRALSIGYDKKDS